MKKLSMIIALVGIMIFPMMKLQAQVVEKAIDTAWITDKGDTLRISVVNDVFFGEVAGLKVPRLDTKNPNPALNRLQINGMIFLRSCKFDKIDKKWKGGIVYDYNDGRYSDIVMSFPDENNMDSLKVTMYNVSYSSGEKTTYWTKKE